MSSKSLSPECSAIVSSKGVLQECHLSVSSQGVPQVGWLQIVTNKYYINLCFSTYVSAFGFVGFILFLLVLPCHLAGNSCRLVFCTKNSQKLHRGAWRRDSNIQERQFQKSKVWGFHSHHGKKKVHLSKLTVCFVRRYFRWLGMIGVFPCLAASQFDRRENVIRFGTCAWTSRPNSSCWCFLAVFVQVPCLYHSEGTSNWLPFPCSFTHNKFKGQNCDDFWLRPVTDLSLSLYIYTVCKFINTVCSIYSDAHHEPVKDSQRLSLWFAGRYHDLIVNMLVACGLLSSISLAFWTPKWLWSSP